MANFTLPELGEGIEEADVLKVLVSPGDVIDVDQPVLEIEMEKATLDVPSSVAGRVSRIAVAEGDTIAPGQLVLEVDEVGAAVAEPPAAAPAGEVDQTNAAPAPEPPPPSAPSPPSTAAPREAAAAPSPAAPATAADAAASTAPSTSNASSAAPSAITVAAPTPHAEQRPVFAAPSVRAFAREIGVNIRDVTGSGPGGRISEDDVKQHARAAERGSAAAAAAAATGATSSRLSPSSAAAPPLPDFSRFGPVERQPLSRFRRTVARNMSLAWAEIPYVTLHHTADVTELEEMRQRYKEQAREAGGNLTLSVVILKIVAAALKAHPRMNASIDTERGELILKRYYHIGVAVDTERGLAVPVIRDVDSKNIIELSVELNDVAERAREGKLTLDEMQGATFTVSNLGSLGTGHFTPIINYPEVGVLGVGRAERVPTYVEGEIQPRLRLPISLSHDHRVIDGADGARFMSWIVDAIRQPLRMAFEG